MAVHVVHHLLCVHSVFQLLVLYSGLGVAVFVIRVGLFSQNTLSLFAPLLPIPVSSLTPPHPSHTYTHMHTHAHTHTQEHCQPHGVHMPAWLHSHQCRHTRAFSLPPLHTHRYTCAHVCVCECLCENVRVCVFARMCVNVQVFVMLCFHLACVCMRVC